MSGYNQYWLQGRGDRSQFISKAQEYRQEIRQSVEERNPNSSTWRARSRSASEKLYGLIGYGPEWDAFWDGIGEDDPSKAITEAIEAKIKQVEKRLQAGDRNVQADAKSGGPA